MQIELTEQEVAVIVESLENVNGPMKVLLPIHQKLMKALNNKDQDTETTPDYGEPIPLPKKRTR